MCMIKFRYLSKYLVLFLLISVLFTGCSKAPIKIGYIGCLTGLMSNLGTNGRDGVLLAVDEVNKSGGINNRQIEILIKDDKNDPETARAAVQELIDHDVDAIIGHMHSSMSIATIPVVNENEILMLSPSTSTNILTGIDDYFIRISPPNKEMMEVLSRYFVEELELKEVACIYDQSNAAYTEEMYHNFKTRFEEFGGTVKKPVIFYASSDVPYMELAEEMLATKPDGVLLLASSFDTAMLSQQIRKLGGKLVVSTSGWAGTDELIQYGGPAVEGLIHVGQFNKDSVHPDFLEFKQKFYETYRRIPGFAATHAYTAAMILFEAMEVNNDFSNLKEKIINIGTFDGLQGYIIVDDFGDTKTKCYLTVIENGQFKAIREY